MKVVCTCLSDFSSGLLYSKQYLSHCVQATLAGTCLTLPRLAKFPWNNNWKFGQVGLSVGGLFWGGGVGGGGSEGFYIVCWTLSALGSSLGEYLINRPQW